MHLDNFFEQLQRQFDSELPFVAYRKPNEATIKALLQNDMTLHEVSDYTENGFVFAPFDTEQKAVLIPYSSSKAFKSEFIKSNDSFKSKNFNSDNSSGRQFHMTLVQKGIDAIANGEFQKVVLSRKESVEIDETNPISIFKNLLNTYETALVYCFYHPSVGLWLGATPETLLKIDGLKLITMALAGTQKYRGTTDVVWHQKETDEQQFVTDFIVKNLQSSAETVQLSETKTVKAGNLLHLQTEINANFKRDSLNLKQLLGNLHPTPAVCGFPKNEAKQFILQTENYNREFYTGFLGELNLKERTSRNSNRHNVENDAYASIKTVTNLYVNLRCMQLKDKQAFIYVGGGITKDSIPENEWEETVSKSQVIKSIL
ncbi:MAG: chorismate-binding protein [Gelidibacter sp.]